MRLIIPITVATLHALLLFSFNTTSLPHPTTIIPRKKIAVQTVFQKQPESPIKKAAPQQKKPAKTPVKQTPPPKPPPVQKKNKAPEPQKKKAAELLRSVEKYTVEKKAPPEPIPEPPSPIPVLPPQEEIIIEEQGILDPSYVEELVATLQTKLQLPEFGDVKVELTIDKFGLLKKMVVISSSSELNSHYLEERLPHLSFPKIPSQKEETFTLVFCNKL